MSLDGDPVEAPVMLNCVAHTSMAWGPTAA